MKDRDRDSILLPPALLAEILPFLEAGKTGRILLGVNRGRIESCEVTVHVRASAEKGKGKEGEKA